MLEVTLLGTGGTMPLKSRWLTACWMRQQGHGLLIDCGEGTQIAAKCAGVSFSSLDVLCLTHYHADHVSGLPGLLLSMGTEGRTEPLTICGPAGLAAVVDGLRVIAPELPFAICLREWTAPEETIQIAGFTISAFAVQHNTVCYGYRISLPRIGRFDVERARALGLPQTLWGRLQREPFVDYEGQIIRQEAVLGPKRRGLSVTYCTDTRPVAALRQFATAADLLICEGMYGDATKQDKALHTGHMTFAEAGALAAQAEPKRLWLTHYSPSLPHPEEFLSEASAFFPTAICGTDGMHILLQFDEDTAT